MMLSQDDPDVKVTAINPEWQAGTSSSTQAGTSTHLDDNRNLGAAYASHEKKEDVFDNSILSRARGLRNIMSHILLFTYEQVRQNRDKELVATGRNSDGKTEPTEDPDHWENAQPARSGTSRALSDEQLQAAASQWKNPIAKIKKDSQFTWRVVADRISVVGLERYPTGLDEETLKFIFNRHYLHHLYGGSFVDTFPRPEQLKVQFHGLADFMCLRLDYNPHAPVNPGDPGLLFTYRSADRLRNCAGGVNRVFVRIQASPALWQYMGQYRLYQSEPLTKGEFASQSSMVRKTWARDVLKRSKGDDIAVRVHLRKTHGREPSLGEVNRVLHDKQKLKAAKTRLTWADVVSAYERGEEEIRVYAMKCVAYDVDFQRTLARNYKHFTPPQQNSKSGPRTKAAVKRKRDSSDTPEPSESDHDVVDVEGEEEKASDSEEAHYEPTGTRSRMKRVKTE
ncbi:uncharacterized protein B0H18DRAFT_1126883 [Fomitopsis serialis]|uniref:uncharacterized protein n=1 Tax=Fomitopsis serialis TaxID=139415 RepID=UPI0020088D8E|nr:uncharacterized protein B0H18DRAFT_1126883 [Neoantrodia serialis]KAH9912707.1 hypothetical protein B0H18DRAFT_1126883 [Neoantrodia serialis]